MKVSKAVKRLRRALRENPEFRESWKANLAMAFYDACPPQSSFKGSKKLDVTNDGAERFLRLLLSQPDRED
ncbi:MAG: hypothetical protein ACXABY_00510 [Candidatus Thorarchaeota archaeon]|jgi:hypothetical protein